MAEVCVRHFQRAVSVEGKSDYNCGSNGVTLAFSAASTVARSVSSREPRAPDTGAASAPYAAVYFRRLPP